MLKYCYEKWDKNKSILESELRKADLTSQSYKSLLELVVRCILNDGQEESYDMWESKRITEIDDGDYQGTLLFLIPKNTYQPSEYEYLMTYIGYGSCSCCDYLQSIEPWDNKDVTDETIKKFMGLCKDFVTNMIKPYNCGWRQDDNFERVTMEEK